MLALKKVVTNNSNIYRREVMLMGNKFEISVVGADPVWAGERINSAIAEINRVEKMLSTFGEDSAVNTINRHAGVKPVKVNAEIYKLIERSLQISELTHGSFDITYYTNDRAADNDDIAIVTYTTVNYKDVVLDAKATTVFLKEKGMRIGFAANSKGYAADRAKYILQLEGVSNGVINASGDLTAWGLQPDGNPWRVGIADPRDPSRILLWLPVDNAAVATSGNYEQYFEIDGVRYSHNIDPRTGIPVRGIKSVSIISPSAELSDALATAVTVMGTAAGLHLIDQLPDVHGIIIDDKDCLLSSKNIATHAYN